MNSFVFSILTTRSCRAQMELGRKELRTWCGPLNFRQARFRRFFALRPKNEHINRAIGAALSNWRASEKEGGFRREVQPRRTASWLNLNEKVGFPCPNRLLLGFQGTKTARREGISSRPSVTPGVALRPRTQGSGIIAAMDEFNRYPVVHTWSYKIDNAADMIRTLETMN